MKLSSIARGALFGLALALVAAACSTTHHASSPTTPTTRLRLQGTTTTAPSWHPAPRRARSPTMVSTCGRFATLRAPSGVFAAGGCGGALSANVAAAAWVHVGDVFTVSYSGGSAPTSANPDVVERIDSSIGVGHGCSTPRVPCVPTLSSAQYRAVANGITTLRVSTIYCDGGPVTGYVKANAGGSDTVAIAEHMCPVFKVAVGPVP